MDGKGRFFNSVWLRGFGPQPHCFGPEKRSKLVFRLRPGDRRAALARSKIDLAAGLKTQGRDVCLGSNAAISAITNIVGKAI